MAEKGNRSQRKAEEIQTRSFSNTDSSNLTSTNTDLPPGESRAEVPLSSDNGKATKPAHPGNSQSGKTGKNITQHLQAIGLIAAIVAIPLAYWQGRLQSSQSKFERNQRVVELSLTLASFWETQLDQDTRYRVGRFIAKLESLKTEEEKKSLVSSLLANINLLDSSSIPQNKFLYELIEPDLGSDTPDGSKMTPVMAVSRYRSALVRALNTMEVIAIAKEHEKELPEALEVIDSAYVGAIQQRYKVLIPFVDAYREQTKVGRRKPAWEPVTRMVEEEDRKLNASVR